MRSDGAWFAGCVGLAVACGDRTALVSTGAFDAGQGGDSRNDGRASMSDAESDASATDATSGSDVDVDAAPTQWVLLFGGAEDTDEQVVGDTWIWNGTSWTQENVPGPSPRAGAAAGTLNGTIVLFGGGVGGSVLGDTWTWDGSTWTEHDVAGPTARSSASMATLGSSVLLFGGVDSEGGPLDDTWIWNGTSWAEQPVSGPAGFQGGARNPMTSLRDSVVLFGQTTERRGMDYFTSVGTTWVWAGASWVRQSATGPDPNNGVMATLGDVALLLDGLRLVSDGSSITWAWNGASWMELPARGPQPLGSAMATWSHTLVLFGGPQVDPGSTWIWDGSMWSERSVPGPSARWGATMATFGPR
jgi:hypothetical protein